MLAVSVGLSGCVGNLPVRVSGFAPAQPALTYRHRFGEVDSLRPILKWAAFPGTEYDYTDLITPVGYRPRPFVSADQPITNVRYDLIVWKAVNPMYDDFSALSLRAFASPSNTFTGRVWASVDSLTPVYERSGLSEPSHAFETTLEANTDYAWSVRARFDVDGRTRVSQWSLVVIPDPGRPSPARGCYEANAATRALLLRNERCAFGGSSRDYARVTGQLPPYALFYFHTPSR
jgi:hypothetical protein